MRYVNWEKIICTMAVLLIVLPTLSHAGQQIFTEKDYYFYEPGPKAQSTLYLDGSIVELETGTLTYPVIGSDLSQVTPAEFREMVLQTNAALDNAPYKTVISEGRSGRGINIVYNCTSVPPAAQAALETVRHVRQVSGGRR